MFLVLVLYALSGFLSLGYQVAWFRIFVDRFGSTSYTFGLVLCSFIGGLGAGSLAGRRLSAALARLTRRTQPLRLYGMWELLVGLSALFTLALPLLPPAMFGAFPYELVDGVQEPSPAYRFSHALITILCVFPPCFAMGTTFPLLCRAFPDRSRFPAGLYAWNTLGAALGILACEFLLLPGLGTLGTYRLMALLNLALGALFLCAPRFGTAAPPPKPAARVEATAGEWTRSTAFAVAAACGLATGAFEADALRRLQFLDCRTDAAMACISFWAILAIFAAGATARAFGGLKVSQVKIAGLLALGIQVLLWRAGYGLRDWANAADLARVQAALPRDTTGLGVPYAIQYFRYGIGSVLAFTGIFVFPAFFLLSLPLPRICNALQAEGRDLGAVYGVNTFAFCIGLAAFSFLVPRVDVFYALRLFPVVLLILAVFIAVLPTGRGPGRSRPIAAALALVLAVLLTPKGFEAAYLPADSPAARYPVRALRSDGAHTTYVVKDPHGDLLYFDSHTMSGCNAPSQLYMRLMAHYPLLAQRLPRSALLICFGVGNTASAIAAHETIESIDVVDLDDQVFATAPEFAAYNRNVIADPRLRLFHDDGRRFLALTDRRYDLITSEPPPPMLAGVFRLYSREYYESVRDHLTEDGLMTQWLPVGQMPQATVDACIATFLSVFPESLLFVGSETNFIIMGGRHAIDLKLLEDRFGSSAGTNRELQALGIESPPQLLARIVAAPPGLRRRYGDARLVHDDGVGFGHDFIDPAAAGRIAYEPDRLLRELPVDDLGCAKELRSLLADLGLLVYAVEDFPRSSLEDIRGPRPARADLDWLAIDRHYELGMKELDAGRPPQAAAALVRALNLGGGALPHVHRRLVSVLVAAGKLEETLESLRRIGEAIPFDPSVPYAAGETLVRLGRRDEAIARFEEAVARDRGRRPLYPRALGDALTAVGRWEEAAGAYRRALEFDPEDPGAEAGLRRCREREARRR